MTRDKIRPVWRVSGCLMFAAALLLLSVGVGHAQRQVPKGIAGIMLGEHIEQAVDKVHKETAGVPWGLGHLTRVETAPLPGFRSGYVEYGNCAQPGRIVRIKLNYEDDSLRLFNTLLDALKKRYGQRPEWRGDAFGTLRVWKWSVPDGKGNSVSIILQNYQGDDDSYSEGTSIRLGVRTWVDDEIACARKRAERVPARPAPTDGRARSLDWLLPTQ